MDTGWISIVPSLCRPTARSRSMMSLAASLAMSASTRSPAGRIAAPGTTTRPLTHGSSSRIPTTSSVIVFGARIRNCNIHIVCAAAPLRPRQLRIPFDVIVG